MTKANINNINIYIFIYSKEETKKNYKFAVTLSFMLYIANSYSKTWTRPKPPVTTKIQVKDTHINGKSH